MAAQSRRLWRKELAWKRSATHNSELRALSLVALPAPYAPTHKITRHVYLSYLSPLSTVEIFFFPQALTWPKDEAQSQLCSHFCTQI